jgi:hypothetical protein
VSVNLQQLEKDGVYEAKASIAAILAELDRIAVLSREAAARRKRLAKSGGVIAVAALVVMIVGAFIGLAWLLVLALVAMLIGLGMMLTAVFATGKLAHHPKRMEITRERLSMIQADAGEKPFSLRLVLASQPSRLRDEVLQGRKKGHQEFFEESWFALQGPLLDGTVLADEIKDLSRRRTYVTPRGKHKVKSRLTYLVNVSFSYSRERYGDARMAQQALNEEVKVGPGALLRKARVTEKAVTLRAMVNSEQEIARTAGMLSMGAYRILNLARRIAEKNNAERKGGNAK